jgi:hypothetical protein
MFCLHDHEIFVCILTLYRGQTTHKLPIMSAAGSPVPEMPDFLAGVAGDRPMAWERAAY